ncbi:hypothetical protein QBC43DRAFT_37928, partial [Cladorrhinum sp. PSN259]
LTPRFPNSSFKYGAYKQISPNSNALPFNSHQHLHTELRLSLAMPDGDQTKDEDYEAIEYYVFPGVEYERWLSWKAGTERVVLMGTGNTTP